MKSIEIITLVYKSIDYLNLIVKELKNIKPIEGWDIKVRVVANDATSQVIEHLKTLDVPYTIYNDSKPNDYYLNRVYRAYNFAGQNSECDNICFINSDMVFSDNWLKNLLKYHDGINIPCSKLIESGKMPSGKFGVSMNFGRRPNEIDRNSWILYTNYITTIDKGIGIGGLFMPCIFEKKRFIEAGMYPEGNIYQQGIGAYNPGHIGLIKSGDAYFFEDILEKKFGMRHITVFDSLIYHVQEGELSE